MWCRYNSHIEWSVLFSIVVRRSTGEMIVSSPKYNVQDTPLSLYETRMTVTIRKFQKEDIGSYRCIAKNSLGEVDSSIRLYGLYSISFFLIRQCATISLYTFSHSVSLTLFLSITKYNPLHCVQKYLIQKLAPVTITIIIRTPPNTIQMIYTNHISSSSSINRIDRQK